MGTVLKKKNESSRNGLFRYAIVLVVIVFIGALLLTYQNFFGLGGKVGGGQNFDIGSLWNSDGTVNNPISDDDIVVKVIPNSSLVSQVISPKPVMQSVSQYIMPSKVLNIAQENTTVEPAMGPMNLMSNMKRFEMSQIPLKLNSGLEDRYWEQLNKDYIFSPEIEANKGKWFVGINFAPSLSYRNYNYTDDVVGVAIVGNTKYTYGMTESYRDRTDQVASTMAVGMDVGYNLNTKLSVTTGLYYSVYGEKISVSKISESDYNTDSSKFIGLNPMYASPDNMEDPTVLGYANTYNSFEIPLNIQYTFLKTDKLDVSVGVGVFYRKLHKVNALVYDFQTDYYYWLSEPETIFRRNSIGGSMAVSLSQFIGKTTEFVVSPQFKYNFHSTYRSKYPVKQNQYGLGLQIGLRKHLTELAQ